MSVENEIAVLRAELNEPTAARICYCVMCEEKRAEHVEQPARPAGEVPTIAEHDVQRLLWDIDNPNQWAPSYFAGWIRRLLAERTDLRAKLEQKTLDHEHYRRGMEDCVSTLGARAEQAERERDEWKLRAETGPLFTARNKAEAYDRIAKAFKIGDCVSNRDRLVTVASSAAQVRDEAKEARDAATARASELERLLRLSTEVLATIAYWHEQGHVDESWFAEAKTASAAARAALPKAGA